MFKDHTDVSMNGQIHGVGMHILIQQRRRLRLRDGKDLPKVTGLVRRSGEEGRVMVGQGVGSSMGPGETQQRNPAFRR